jgi:hypothetical protein
VREIRAGEDAARRAGVADVEPHLVLFEPSVVWSAAGRGPPPDFAHDRDVVYAPHIYTGGFTNGPVTAAAFEIARDEAGAFGGAPVLSGEWGSDPRRASDPADGYFLTHQELQDEFQFSATLWTWRESCGDPHKVGDFRAGRIPYVWGRVRGRLSQQRSHRRAHRPDRRAESRLGSRRAGPPGGDALGRGLELADGARSRGPRGHRAAGVLSRGDPRRPNDREHRLDGRPHRRGTRGGLYVVATSAGGPWTLDASAP